MLLEKHKQQLARFRIPIEMLRAAHVESINDTKARALLGVHGRANDDLGGIVFPYLSPISGERKGARIRLDEKTEDDAKYLSEAGCRHLFFAPGAKELLEDKSAPIVIVEAEKSALALAAYAQRVGKKLLVIAIGGCWGWRRNDGKVETPSGGMKSTSGPSPDFNLFQLENRVVAIAFDSNASTNKKVQAARDALARELIKRGANVMIADVTDANGVNGPDDLIAELGDDAVMKMFVEAKSYTASVALLADMSESVLDGRLGEIFSTHMAQRFPIAYAWPALVTVASSLVPRYGEKQRLNLYTALSGPVHSGKTQTIDAAQQLLGVESPILMDVMAGSAESLMRYMGDAAGAPRLFSPDELGHTLEKASIQNASFASVLSRAFSHTKFTLLMKEKARAEFNASLSILGGIVDDRFEDLFSRSTTQGLYDRFLFGACPSLFEFNYYPFDAGRQSYEPDSVFVAPEVWAEKSSWQKKEKIESRIIELALRVAIVCAAFDGRTLLTVKDLGPAKALAEYQMRIRRMLKPNEGENLEAKIALKILAYLDSYEGRYVSKRKLLHDTGAYRYSPSVAQRALKVMDANGDIEMTTGRPFKVRLLNMNGDGE